MWIHSQKLLHNSSHLQSLQWEVWVSKVRALHYVAHHFLQHEAATTARKGYCPARIHGHKYLRPMCQLLEDSSLKQACHALLVANSGGSLLVCAGAQLENKSCKRNHWASRFLPSIAWGCRFSRLCDKFAAHECTSMPAKADEAWALLSWPEFVRGTAAPALKRSSLWTSISQRVRSCKPWGTLPPLQCRLPSEEPWRPLVATQAPQQHHTFFSPAQLFVKQLQPCSIFIIAGRGSFTLTGCNVLQGLQAGDATISI